MRSYALKETWHMKNVQLKHLAPAFGFWLLSTLATKTLQSFDASITLEDGANPSRLYMPSNLQAWYKRDDLDATTLPTGDGLEHWKFMEETIAKNISTSIPGTTAEQTYGQRFEFLRTCFIANLKHKVKQVHKGPKMVVTGAREVAGYTNLNDFIDLPNLHVDNWPDLLRFMNDTHVIYPRDMAHGPDVFAKLLDDSDPSNPVHHLLCFQVKYGKQDLSFWDVLDELAKCPFVSVEENVSSSLRSH